MGHPINWDDWRVVSTLAHAGTAGAAARELGMDLTTVLRRIERIEGALGVTLFERDRTGMRATLQAETVLGELASMQELADNVESRLVGLDSATEGDVVLSVNHLIVEYLLLDALKQFRAKYPAIHLTIDANDRLVDLKAREADVVLRGSNDPDPQLFGLRLWRLRYGIYASSEWAEQTFADPQSVALDTLLHEHDWIGFSGILIPSVPGKWMKRHVGDRRIRCAVSEMGTAAHLSASGFGLALLPRLVADKHPSLRQIGDLIDGLYSDMWLLTRKELRSTARVAALIDCLKKIPAEGV